MSQQLQQLAIIERTAPELTFVRRWNQCSKCHHERTHHIDGTCRDCGCYARRKANTVKHAVRVLQDLEDLE